MYVCDYLCMYVSKTKCLQFLSLFFLYAPSILFTCHITFLS